MNLPPSADLVDCLRRLAQNRPEAIALIAHGARGDDRQLNYSTLDRRVRSLAARLRARFAPGERVLLLLDNDERYVIAFFACLYAGLIAVPAFAPQRRQRARLEAIAADSDACCALVGSAETPTIADLPAIVVEPADETDAGSWRERRPDPEDLALLQYTSGSTAAPKGVMLSHANLIANERAIEAAMNVRDDDVIVSWLPLYHDMGLIGGLLQPIHRGVPVVLMSPQFFLERPARWLEAIARFRGTISGGPDFAYRLCLARAGNDARANDDADRKLDLSSWRIAVSGAEPVRHDTLEAFTERYASAGFSASAFYPCYGLAESVLMVTGGERSAGAQVARFSIDALAQDAATPDPNGRALVGCGASPPGHSFDIVDPVRLTSAPDGWIGEIWASGPSLAQGYWRRTDATAETFVTRDGVRWLRTGDLGFAHNGRLFVAGRRKDLIILRGQNVYPQDIEAAVERELEFVRGGRVAAFAVETDGREGVGVAAEIGRGARKLVAPQILARAIGEVVAEACQEAPALIALLEPGALPKTSSGKLQRAACRRELLDGDIACFYREGIGASVAQAVSAETEIARAAAPMSETERRLAEIWAEKLGGVPPLAEANFFALGGNSIDAVRVLARIAECFDVDLDLPELFEAPTLAAMAAKIEQSERRATRSGPIATPESFPLSPAQRSLWLTWKLDPESAAYNLPGALHLRGPLDLHALRSSLLALIERHAVLRTSIHPGPDDEPTQAVQAASTIALDVVDLRERDAAARRDALERFAVLPFAFDREPPFRAALHRLGAEDHLLALSIHHIAADGWSMSVLVDEFAELYEAFATNRPARLPPPPMAFADYARAQRDALGAETLRERLAYWRAQLGDEHPVLDLPRDRERRPDRSAPEARHRFALPTALASELRGLARRENATPYVAMLALFYMTLHRYSGQTDLRVGAPVADRRRPDTQGLVGYLTNVLVLRAQLDPRENFRALLGRVRASLLGAMAHELPIDALVEALQPARNAGAHPLFQAKCTELPPLASRRVVAGLEMRPQALTGGRAHFDLSLDYRDDGGAVEAELVYAADLLDGARVADIARAFCAIAEQALAAPDRPLATLAPPDASTAQEGERIEFPAATFLDLFERRVTAAADAPAIQDDATSLSYSELDARAERLAAALVALGLVADSRVALHAPRGCAFAIGALAIMKAGGAFVPLDPRAPAERLKAQCEDSGARVLLSVELPSWAPPNLPFIALDIRTEGAAPAVTLDKPHPLQVAYVIYTSGSTGEPKGVAVSHAALADYVQGLAHRLDLCETRRFAMISSVAADLGHTTLFGALSLGKSLHFTSDDHARDPDRFVAFMTRAEIDVLKIAPSHLEALLQAADPAAALPRSLLVLGGEAASPDLLQRIRALRPDCRVVNHYGPTETTVGVLTQRLEDAPASEAPPLGAPLPNCRIMALDSDLQPVPQGVAGELYIGGAGLARGYLDRPGRTAERFVADPRGNGERLYRSGDRVRLLPDGRVAFLGRIDEQVKIRGFRVEPRETAAALRALDGVRDAAVVARGGAQSRIELHAYVVMRDACEFDATKLRAALAATLPDYMLPSTLTALDAMPLNANGKLDLRALPDPIAPSVRPYEPPRGEREETLAAVWAEALGAPRVGRDDDFFELGGDSIIGLKIIARARRKGLKFTPKQLFGEPTVRRLAAALDSPRPESGIPRRPSDADAALSYAQSRLWFLWRLEPDSHAYNVPGALRLRGTLDRAALRRTFGAIVTRHESLRTTFHQDTSGEAVQHAQAPADVPLDEIDLRDLPSAERERRVAELAATEARAPFDLEAGPMLRARLIALDETDHALLVTMHHIVSDGWSLNLLVDEFAAFYAAFSRGEAPSLPPLAIQYVDYAIWQRKRIDGEEGARQLAFWKRALGDEHPTLELPTDRARPTAQSYVGREVFFEIDGGLAEKLRALAQAHRASLFMVLLAAFDVLLHRWSGQTEIRVGAPVANRDRPELEKLIGFFVNAQVTRATIDGDCRFVDILEQIRDSLLEAQAYQELPFERLVEAINPPRSLGRHPLFQVTHNHRRRAFGALARLPGLEITEWPIETRATQFDLTLNSIEFADDDRLWTSFTYAVDLFDHATIERMAAQYRRLLHAVAETPSETVSALPLVEAEARASIAAPLATRPCLHQLFEAQTDRTPEAIALVQDERGRLSFRELDRRASRLARRLRRLGVGPDVVVPLCLERSFETAVAMLAVLKAGGAYAPLDPHLPRERLAQMLADSGSDLLLIHEATREAAPEAARVLDLDALGADEESDERLPPSTHPDNLAYCIYTSGSSGRPKAVQISHAAIVNHMEWMRRAFPFGEGDSVLQKTAYGFDASVWEFWLPLVAGGRCALAPASADRDLDQLWPQLVRHKIDVLQLVPSVLRLLLERPDAGALLRPVRALFCGGEALAPRLVGDLRRVWNGALVNLYGPTETTIDASFWACGAREDGRNVPIGHPIAHTDLHVLDERLAPTPIGVVGELFIGGRCLARSYLGRPGQTAERFVADPLGLSAGGRLYRTGDLARLRADGAIDYVGRADQQVKLRGFRIELGEIEARLRETGLVEEAAALALEDAAGDKRLVAYVSPDRDALKARNRRDDAVDEWRNVFETVYDGASDDAAPDFTGWISSYTGLPIAREDMQEWLDATIDRIARHAPRRILEIGCGSGLLLERLAPTSAAYVGTDFSGHALARLGARLRGRDDLRHVELRQQDAASFDGLEEGAFDMVVLNSIVQYFPDADYLVKVLRGTARLLAPGGRIFVGDVRDLGRLALFHTSVQLAKAPADLPATTLAHLVEEAISNEEELLLAPAFFAALADELPGLSSVEPELKRGRADTELTRYRYDVTLRIGGGAPAPSAAPIAWGVDIGSLDEISAHLANGPARLTIIGAPEQRLDSDRAMTLLLRDERLDASALCERSSALASPGENPESFRALGEGRGYRTLPRPSAEPGFFDVDFLAPDVACPPPALAERQTHWRAHANDPLLARLLRGLEPELKDALRRTLPDYMLPAKVVTLDRMPLTANGKLDRRALPRPSFDDASDHEPPQGEIEIGLAALWAEALGVSRVGRRDDFFARGGHSLAATRLVARLRHGALCGHAIDLPLRNLFAAPILADQAAWIAEHLSSAAAPTDTADLVAAPPGDTAPLSPMQRRLWLVERLSGGATAYNMIAALRLDGELSSAALRESLARTIERHEPLRTIYVEDADGEPIAQLRPAEGFELRDVDLANLDAAEQDAAVAAAIRTEATRPFDLRQAPMMRASLLALGPTRHVLLLAIHHIAADGWSVSVLVREATQIYESLRAGAEPVLAPLPLRYRDYAIWHAGMLTPSRLRSEADFWRAYLRAAPTRPPLAGDRPRPAVADHSGDVLRLRLPAQLRTRLETVARDNAASSYMALLSVFALLLHRESGSDDLLIGADVAHRRHPGLENLVGFFVNLLPVRSRIERGMRFVDLLAETKSRCLEAFEHQDLPFDRIVEFLGVEVDRGGNPLVQILFVMQNAPRARFDIAGLAVETMTERDIRSKFDMALFVAEDAEGFGVDWVYATALFDRPTIERLAAEWSALLARVLAEPEASLETLAPPRAEKLDKPQKLDKRGKLDKLKAIAAGARRPATPASPVRISRIGDGDLPLVIEPATPDLDPRAWASAQRAYLDGALDKHAAILFRGFGVDTPQEFEAFAEAIEPELYGCYGDLPKNESGRRTYHSTPYPEQQMILYHNESSHLSSWPRKQLFYCHQPAASGGATPIVDCREVYRRLPMEIADLFERKQLLYVRNFADRLDVGWRAFFKTDRREDVEERLRSEGVDFRWLDRDALQTRTLCPAVIVHPTTGERVFFNQLQLHHIACLEPGVRKDLLGIFGVEGMPRHVYFGDGSPIDDEIVDLVGRLYEDCAVRFPWRRGDVLLVDNMLAAHARDPFEGQRRIVVAMGAMFDRSRLAILSREPAVAAMGE